MDSRKEERNVGIFFETQGRGKKGGNGLLGGETDFPSKKREGDGSYGCRGRGKKRKVYFYLVTKEERMEIRFP